LIRNADGLDPPGAIRWRVFDARGRRAAGSVISHRPGTDGRLPGLSKDATGGRQELMQNDDPDFRLPKETILIGATLFCLGALFAMFTTASKNYSPPPSAIAYPIDAGNS
jgi:hypothetical protein